MNNSPEITYLNIEYIFNQVLHSFEYFSRLENFYGMIRPYILIIVFFLSVIIFILVIKIFSLKTKHTPSFADKIFEGKEQPEERTNRWQAIKEKIDSDNHSEWCAAVIMADDLLDEIFEKIGYKGENLEEKLKVIEPSDFDNLKNLWEAHQIKKRLDPKTGFAFELTKEEAKIAIDKYAKALKELKYI
ncbi:MAG: hypothetical protein AB1643_03095 [Patescibacteria group bacterium]